MDSKQVTRLRGWMRKYPLLGTLLVGGFLGMRYLWMKRRVSTIAAGIIVLLGTILLLLRPVQSPRRVSAHGRTASIGPPPVSLASAHPDLLDRARQVVDTRMWASYFYDYYWLSNNEVLYSHKYGQQSSYATEVFRENLTTHVRQSLPRLSRLTDALSTKHSQVLLSPDRHWFLRTNTDSEEAIATPLNGSIHATWSRPSYGVIGWLADSRHWIEFAENRNEQVVDGLIIRDALHPHNSKNIPIRLSTFHEGFPFVTSDNHYFVNTWNGKVRVISHVGVYEGDLEHPNAPPSKYSISLPPNSEINDIVYSPSGDRIAWLLTSALDARTGIWISRLDGSKMHEVGSVKGSSDDEPWYNLPHTMHWLPSDSSLSFLCQDALWTVPVD